MLTNVDLANHDGALLCYVAHSEGGIDGTVTVLFKFAEAESLGGSCLKLRFATTQFRAFQRAIAASPEFPGIDIGVGGDDFDACQATARAIWPLRTRR